MRNHAGRYGNNLTFVYTRRVFHVIPSLSAVGEAAGGGSLTRGTSFMLLTTTPWYCGVPSVIRARPLLMTWLPYKNDCSCDGFTHTLYCATQKNHTLGVYMHPHDTHHMGMVGRSERAEEGASKARRLQTAKSASDNGSSKGIKHHTRATHASGQAVWGMDFTRYGGY